MKGGNDLQPGELNLEKFPDGHEGPEYFTHVAGGESFVDPKGYSIPGHRIDDERKNQIERKKQIDESAKNLHEKLIHLFNYKYGNNETLNQGDSKLITGYVDGWKADNNQGDGILTGHDDLIKRVIEENGIVILDEKFLGKFNKKDAKHKNKIDKMYQKRLESILDGLVRYF